MTPRVDNEETVEREPFHSTAKKSALEIAARDAWYVLGVRDVVIRLQCAGA